MSLSKRIANGPAYDRTYAEAMRDAAYDLGTRCPEAEMSRTCPYNHTWRGDRAYHRTDAPVTVSPFTARALTRSLPGKVL